MGAKLDMLIDAHIAPIMETKKQQRKISKAIYGQTKEALYEKFRREVKEEIKKEMTAEEIAEQKKIVDKEIDKYALKKKLHEIKNVVIEGIFLAIVVGLLVNQFTDMITYHKSADPETATRWIISILLVALLLYVLVRFSSAVSKLNGKDD